MARKFMELGATISVLQTAADEFYQEINEETSSDSMDVLDRKPGSGKIYEKVQESTQENTYGNTDENIGDTTLKNTARTKDISAMSREETLETLLECGKIAANLENLSQKKTELYKSIQETKEEIEKIRNTISQNVQTERKIIFALAFFIPAIFMYPAGIILGFILIGVSKIVMDRTIVQRDLEEHREENEFNAQEYSVGHLDPLEKELGEVDALLDYLKKSGKIAWATNVVGKELFMSEIIGELYHLIKSHRADSYKEALNLYDNAKYQERMEEMQRAIKEASEISAVESAKQSAAASEIEKNTRQTAKAAKFTAATSYGTYRNTKKIKKNTKK